MVTGIIKASYGLKYGLYSWFAIQQRWMLCLTNQRNLYWTYLIVEWKLVHSYKFHMSVRHTSYVFVYIVCLMKSPNLNTTVNLNCWDFFSLSQSFSRNDDYYETRFILIWHFEMQILSDSCWNAEQMLRMLSLLLAATKKKETEYMNWNKVPGLWESFISNRIMAVTILTESLIIQFCWDYYCGCSIDNLHVKTSITLAKLPSYTHAQRQRQQKKQQKKKIRRKKAKENDEQKINSNELFVIWH